MDPAYAPAFGSGLALLFLGVGLAFAAVRVEARYRVRGRSTLLAALAVGMTGTGLGLREGARAVASCAASLHSGDGVVVEGRLTTDLGPAVPGLAATGAQWARLLLARAELAHRGRVCRLPRLSVRVLRPEAPRPAGHRVRVAGEWRRYGSGRRSGPRTPSHYGAVYGTLVPHPPSARRRSAAAGAGLLVAARARASRRLERLLPFDVAPASRALVLADRSELAPSVTRSFVDAGLAHLLAISGLHVGLLAAGVLWIAGLFLGTTARWVAAAIVTAGYVIWIGAPPAAMRASIVFAGWAAARIRGAPARLGDLLGWAGAASLIGSPLLLVHPGFQMSFAGVIGLWGGGRVGARAAERLSKLDPRSRAGRSVRRISGFARLLGASTGAFLLTAPLAVAHFGRIAPASVLSSLLGAPLVALALAGLFPALLLPEPIAILFAAGAVLPLRGLIGLSEGFARLPLHAAVSPPDAVGWCALGLAAAGAIAMLSEVRRVRARGLLALTAAVALWTAAPGVRALAGGRSTLLCTLAVGQGDAAVLRTRRGHWIVFDAGPGPGVAGAGISSAGGGRRFSSYDAGARVLVPFLRRHGARSVDLFVLSHPHLDHLGGAGSLLRAFPVRRVLDAGVPVPSTTYLRYLARLEEEGVRWLPARSGARLRLDEVEILVLAPSDSARGGPGPIDTPDSNEVSMAVRVRIGAEFVYLNSGDAPARAEAEILSRWPADSLRADLLKLGHHGSRTSSSLAWISTTRPGVAVISSGAGNRYGHPHAATLARLDSAAVPSVWRTDRLGTLCVEVERDGEWRLRRG